MFYFSNWDKFCKSVSQTSIRLMKAQDLLDDKSNEQFIVFKHDVEMNPSLALRLAQIEHQYGIKGTYYVQAYLLDNNKNIAILQQIQALGHEVSYHYDVLDANNGDFIKADADFKHYIERFESYGFHIKTICQHGNPVKKRINYTSNRDFFRNPEIIKKYTPLTDVVVNFKEKTGKNYIYISDYGYSWKIISDPENDDKNSANIPLSGFDRILDLIFQGNSIILSTHPHRWKQSKISIYCKIVFFKLIRFMITQMSKFTWLAELLNKFYFLAKKI